MSGHADTIRRRLRGDPSSIGKGHPDALDALNALLTENQRLREALERIAATAVRKDWTELDRVITMEEGAREALAEQAKD